ncbi:MAG: tRNA-dihydrouridine synthase [Candidatus Paceibacterota bacterium]|jgi:nifR3 family TIM-barrel protein
MENFWQKLKKPIFALAPMADVTDIAFREIITEYGKPDVLWTEFVSADGLVSDKGREHLMIDLAYTEVERPIVAQLFTSKPENMRKAAEIVRDLGFDGLDINMGCPDRTIEKQGAGAALMKNPKLAQEIIYAAKEGAGSMPISVKTRLGYNKDVLEEWLPAILEAKPAAITVHARTRKEMSKVPARWERVADAVKIAKGSGVLILGNGDVTDLADAEKKVKESGADGAMLGRAIFGNPWLFSPQSLFQCSQEQKLKVMIEHTKLFEKLLGGKKNFAIMKKHYKAYSSGFDGAKELRMKLMEAENAAEVEGIVKRFLSDRV